MLRSLPGWLRELLPTDDPRLERLFPPAYPGDRERTTEYDRLVREDLVAERLSAAETMERTIDAKRLTEDELAAWLGAINDLRLVLGTQLDVTEEVYEREPPDDDPRAPAYALYYYLGWLEDHVVQALASGLDPAGTEPA